MRSRAAWLPASAFLVVMLAGCGQGTPEIEACLTLPGVEPLHGSFSISDSAPLAESSGLVGQLLSLSLVADAKGDATPALDAQGLPLGATFTDNGDGTGLIRWAPGFENIENSPHMIRVTATYGDESAHSQSIEISVDVAFRERFAAGMEPTANRDCSWELVLDEPSSRASWSVIDGALHQKGKVESVRTFDGSYHRGAYALLPMEGNLSDYRFTVDATYLATQQANDIGVMFRYQDNDNYYRLSMNGRYGFTRLVSRVDGVFTPLAVNGRGYTPGEPLRFTVELEGSLIRVWVDGDPVFAVEDDALSSGTVALYTQDESAFDQVLIEAVSRTPSVTITSPFAHSVGVSDAIEATAVVSRAPPEARVEFSLDDGASTVVDSAAPYAADFASLFAGGYTVEAILRDADGKELARDTRPGVGVSGEYLVAIGDSITNGIGDRYSRDNRARNSRVLAVQGYQAPLVDLLERSLQRPVIVYNAGIGGDGSFRAAFERADSILARHPGSNTALVLLGTNDANRKVPSGLGCADQACDGTFKGNMQALLDTLTAAGKTVYVGHPPPLFGASSGGTPYTNPLSASRNETIQEYNAVIDSELNGANPGPDFFSFFLGPSVNRFSLFDDPLHPNALGHATIAHLWQNALNPGAPVPLPFLLDNLSRSATAPYLKQNLLQEGNAAYVDRSHRLTAIPSVLEEGVWINTADNDAGNTEDVYLSFDVAQRVKVYVAYDAAATSLPAWLGGYTDTGLTVGTDNPQAPSLRVHARAYDAGTIGLGGNMARGAVGANAHYLVFVKPL